MKVTHFVGLILLFALTRVGYGQNEARLTPPSTSPPGVLPRQDIGIFKNIYVVPYLTGSGNFHSGMAFPKSASGIGFGGGLELDMTEDGQHFGPLIDFAFQDMRAYAKDGSCVQTPDSILETGDASHYFQYLLVETFLKIQGAKNNGYLLVGASFGYGVSNLTQSSNSRGTDYAYWDATQYGNRFRFDLRAGLGLLLGSIGTHRLIFEGRVGYPLTNVISNYHNACSAGTLGDWRIITVQANLGLRL